jgi:SAM-dependent methyltransferase
VKSGWQILIRAIWRKPVATLDKAAGSMRQWFASSLGRAMLDRELPLIEAMRQEHASQAQVRLMVTAASHSLFAKPSTSQLDIRVFPGLHTLRCEPQVEPSSLVCQLEEIPLPDNSVDFILLHHVLEFSENPHGVLREVVRVLAPRGHLLIVGFNPWSLFGLRGAVERMFRLSVPWAQHRLSSGRLTDWLYLMSCEPAGYARGFYTVPLQSANLRRVFGFAEPLASRMGLPGGGFFMIHATKNVFGRLQRKPQRELRPQLVPFPVASPAAKVINLVRKSDR